MDIELAVKGVNHNLFYDLHAELWKHLPKPIELVNLDDTETDEYFAKSIMKEGILIYSAPNFAERESPQETKKTGTTIEDEGIMLY